MIETRGITSVAKEMARRWSRNMWKRSNRGKKGSETTATYRNHEDERAQGTWNMYEVTYDLET
jgi:hypothetical protein